MVYCRYGFNKMLKTKKTYEKWISALIRFIFPDSSITMKLLGFINDTYKVDSIENMTRQKRGTSSTKFNNTGFEQNMLEGKNWQELLNDSQFKDQLIEITKEYVLELGTRILPRSTPFVTTSREKEYFISPTENQVITRF